MRLYFPLAALLFLTAPLAQAVSSGGVLGDWQTPSGSVLRVDRCGVRICLRIEKLPPGASSTDIHNPDPALHSQPLCGMEIGKDFILNDTNHAAGGTLYDPKTGNTYHGAMTAEGDLLHLRGYIGIPLLGRSQTWKRLSSPVQTCGARP